MYPNTGEWAQIFVLFLMGPLHLVGAVIVTAFAWWRAAGWSMAARLTVLAANVLLASAPVVVGLSTGQENESFHQYSVALAACELVMMSGLAAVLIFRRAAVAPQR